MSKRDGSFWTLLDTFFEKGGYIYENISIKFWKLIIKVSSN